MLQFILNRFKEPTSWFAVMLLAGSFGFELSDAQQNAITIFGMAMFAAPESKVDELIKKTKTKKKPNSDDPTPN
jgi:hypothetical protein